MRRPREAKVMDDMSFLEFVAIFGGGGTCLMIPMKIHSYYII